MATSTEHAAASVQGISATTLKIELGVLAAPLRGARLLERSVDLDLASRAEVDAPIHHHRDREAGRHRRAIAPAVLFRRVEELINLASVESVEDCRAVGAVPCFRGNGPHDGILVAVCGNRGRGTGILELCFGGGMEDQMTILDGIVA
jgi:hypothetical protein